MTSRAAQLRRRNRDRRRYDKPVDRGEGGHASPRSEHLDPCLRRAELVSVRQRVGKHLQRASAAESPRTGRASAASRPAPAREPRSSRRSRCAACRRTRRPAPRRPGRPDIEEPVVRCSVDSFDEGERAAASISPARRRGTPAGGFEPPTPGLGSRPPRPPLVADRGLRGKLERNMPGSGPHPKRCCFDLLPSVASTKASNQRQSLVALTAPVDATVDCCFAWKQEWGKGPPGWPIPHGEILVLAPASGESRDAEDPTVSFAFVLRGQRTAGFSRMIRARCRSACSRQTTQPSASLIVTASSRWRTASAWRPSSAARPPSGRSIAP